MSASRRRMPQSRLDRRTSLVRLSRLSVSGCTLRISAPSARGDYPVQPALAFDRVGRDLVGVCFHF
jgi:hypothetical protein